MSAKYVFVTGGVVSGLGKGITAASLGRLLKQRGLKVTIQKFDPYLNVEPGRLSPLQHGEVFITEDGAETDLDLGHYERFIDEFLDRNSTVTGGRVYQTVIKRELSDEFSGNTVQVVPHVTNEIKTCVQKAAKADPKLDVVISEIGGTVGDMEIMPFLEAIRQVANDIGRNNCVFIHVPLLPTLGFTGEIKTKPAQHSVKQLMQAGIQPDVLVCRVDGELDSDTRRKLALFCNVANENVIVNANCNSLYEVPLMLNEEGLDDVVCKSLGLKTKKIDLAEWKKLVFNVHNLKDKPQVKIALVGSFVELCDAYLSVKESLYHAGIRLGVNVDIEWISSNELNHKNVKEKLGGINGVLVPGDRGANGTLGKLEAIKFAREGNLPFLGINGGMLSVLEFYKNVLNKTDSPFKEGDMRVGSSDIKLDKNSNMFKCYGTDIIRERHCSALEITENAKQELFSNGLKESGTSLDGKLTKAIELSGHKFFIGVLFHPEFRSRPTKPHPLFIGFIKACKG